jgi:hypothetical protein
METTKTNTQRCSHATTEWLGVSGRMEFLRCLACQSVIVAQGDVTYSIPPVQPAPAAPASADA